MITALKSSKIVTRGIIAAVLVLLIGSIWMGRTSTQESSQATEFTQDTAQAAAATASPSPVLSVETPSSPSASKENQGHPLSPEEVDRISSWYRDRGVMEDVRKLADGSFVGGDAFSSYRNTDDAGLAAFAKGGDPYAAQMLGERLSKRYLEKHNKDDLQEAKRWLLEATMRGFTTSLAEVYKLQLSVAQSHGIELHKNAPAVDNKALLEAYEYLYLLERRGDLSIDAYKTMAQTTRRLNADEDLQVRNRANELYESMSEQRQQLGLQPFVDGVPDDIRNMMERAMAYTMGGQMTYPQKPLPITLLSGFLGAGKTTVLGELLRHQHGRRVAVIVNDMSELNIDADIARTLLMEPDGTRLVELQNGCICCTLRDDLVSEISQLARSGTFDYLLIESTGISEPLPVAAAFSHPLPDNTQLLLSDVAQLDTLVTVVDGLSFLDVYRAGEALKDDEAERTLSDLLIEQIEFANVLLVSKADLLTENRIQQLTAILQILNPSARIVPIAHGKVDPDVVLGTCLYNSTRMSLQPGWMAALRGEKLPESEEYEIDSFTWAARRPMHPERFWNLLSCTWQAGDVLRSKGFFWLATRPLNRSLSTSGRDSEGRTCGNMVGRSTSRSLANQYRDARLDRPQMERANRRSSSRDSFHRS